MHQSFNRYTKLMITNETKILIVGTATPYYEGDLIITNENYKILKQSRFFYLSNNYVYKLLDQVFETDEFLNQYYKYDYYFKNTRMLMDSDYIEKLNSDFIDLFKKYKIAFWDIADSFDADNGHEDHQIYNKKSDKLFLKELKKDIILVSNMMVGGNSWNQLTDHLKEVGLEEKFKRDAWPVLSQKFKPEFLVSKLKSILLK